MKKDKCEKIECGKETEDVKNLKIGMKKQQQLVNTNVLRTHTNDNEWKEEQVHNGRIRKLGKEAVNEKIGRNIY